MFWILFLALIFLGCAASWLVDFFQQMKTSEYEAVRVMYWFLVTAFWVLILIWLYNIQGKQVGETSKISLASQKKDVILIV